MTILSLAAECGISDERKAVRLARPHVNTDMRVRYRNLTDSEIALLQPIFTSFVNERKAEEEKRLTKPRLEADGCMVYLFDKWRVRVTLKDGQTWFVAKDVAEALGYTWNGSARIEHVPEKWRGVTSVVTLRGDPQDMAILSLPGLFFFLNRSDKPAAFPFQEWVNGEVLPSIQRTGSYAAPGISIPHTLPEALRLAADLEEKRLALVAKVEADAPKVEGYERFLDASGSMCISDAAKALGQGPAHLFDLLAEKHLIFRRGGEWVAAQDQIDRGWLIVRALKIPDLDKGGTKVQTRVTAKGLAGISGLLGKREAM